MVYELLIAPPMLIPSLLHWYPVIGFIDVAVAVNVTALPSHIPCELGLRLNVGTLSTTISAWLEFASAHNAVF